MSGLIEEIQRDALDKSVATDALLRRVKLAAAKLQLDTLEIWVEHELNGYRGELPDYRKIIGQPAAWNPYNGWIPVFSSDEKFMELISEAPIRQSVATLQDLIDNNAGGSLHFPLPSGLVAKLNELMNFQTSRMVLQFGRGHIIGILDTVRNMVLEWAIQMEKKGVLGHSMSFDTNEKIQAKQAMTTFNIGNIGSFVGNLGAGNTSGDIVASIDVVDRVKDVIEKIRLSSTALVDGGIDGHQLSSNLAELEAEANSAEPKRGRLKGLLEDTRTILTGAAGNLTAEGAIAMVSAIAGALG
ncbi:MULTISPECIES: hypothetical protein [unclassified Ensifer]|uniref:AbiTii domain-containing protein n=1 Tax=unclassified Ensifer TaxID=2633371 RepID=UPI000812C94C|nr:MULTISPECIES: hypothetical protein [unclassified Ensifer]OCP11805.1 hypothetical protein BC374_16120 [Ensifer sp. LC13]